MQKDNNQPDVHPTEFAILLLKALLDEPKQLKRAREFFLDHFAIATDHDFFNDRDYRMEYANHLENLRNLAHPNTYFKGYEVKEAIEDAMKVLELHATTVISEEVKHD